MSPRPLYRWKSFWIGLFILAFLAWAWVGSMKRALIITPWDQSRVSMTSISGRFEIWLMNANLLRDTRGIQGYRPDPKSLHWFAVPVRVETAPVGRSVSVAYWLVSLLFFGSWASFITWRWRRQRQHLAMMSELPPE
jgi:hypothetical protein